jgi:hypothetical protein
MEKPDALDWEKLFSLFSNALSMMLGGSPMVARASAPQKKQTLRLASAKKPEPFGHCGMPAIIMQYLRKSSDFQSKLLVCKGGCKGLPAMPDE